MAARLRILAAMAATVVSASSLEAAPHYAVRLRVDPNHEQIRSSVRIDLDAQESAAGRTFLLSRNYKVDKLSSSPNAIATIADTDQPFPGLQRIDIKRRAGSTGPSFVEVDYHGRLLQTDDQPINQITPRRLELSADSLWYPLPQNFNTRFTLDARVSGLANQMIISSPDQVRYRGTEVLLHRRVPSQDIAFSGAVGAKTVQRGDLTISAADLSHPRTREFIRNAPRALAFLERWFGPIPSGKATIAIVDRANGTGYSRPGYLVVADSSEPFPPGDAWGPIGYVAHELSHNWWSNADFTGEDYWLVESTAEYSALRFIESERGATALAPLIANKTARAAKAGPILGHGRPSSDAVYAKGPLLLIKLEHDIGRARLDRILAWAARRRLLTTADFLSELSRAAGPQAAAAFEAELRR